MASEARIQSSLQIKVGEIVYQSKPTAFVGGVTGKKGPVPGAFAVSAMLNSITTVDFSQLVNPGYVRLQNLDSVVTATYGIYDPNIRRFYPFGEMKPGETYVLRFSQWFQESFLYPGTSTSGEHETIRLAFLGNGTAHNVLVEAFET